MLKVRCSGEKSARSYIAFPFCFLLLALMQTGCFDVPKSNFLGESRPPLTFAISPERGPVGTLLTLTGMDFSAIQTVSIGSGSAILISQSTTSLVALVMPDATSGPVNVTSRSASFTSSAFFGVTATGAPATQQGAKLVGAGGVGTMQQGYAVSLSADGNTALIGGPNDNTNIGAAWVFTRSGGVWTQQGAKLVGTGAVGAAAQGYAVSLNADGNTALIGGGGDNGGVGAAWVFTRSGGVWTQQGAKLVGTER
ncbi:MAG: IPT/TIG domain-containing protein [Deltaproteobacteria bacterium]|nr:IPT/TIG domain-containing protein [Deltaproteobacteria bacterium]